MPFSGASDPKLPSNVADLSLAKRRQWVGMWNGRFADCQSDGGTTAGCESSAFAVANAAIKELAVVEILSTDEDTEEGAAVEPGDARFLQVEGEVKDGPTTTTVSKASHPVSSDQDRYFRGAQRDTSKNFVGEMDYWDFASRRLDQKSANYNPVGGTSEKACSNCQWFISPANCSVVDSYPDPIAPNGNSDLWRERVDRSAQLDPLEVVIVGERDAEIGEKQETKTEDGVAYPARDFAVVPDAETPSGWKLRLAEGSAGNVTVAQVARAITAMQPGGFRGNRVSLTGDQKAQAIRRIGGAIGRSGGDDDQKANLRERLDAVKARANWWEVIVTGPQALKALAAKQLEALKGLRSTDDGEAEDSLAYDSSLTMFKDVDGNTRFLAIMSNRYRDRDKEIIAEAAHREFVGYLDGAQYKDDKGKPLMEAWLWHTPGTKWGAVDWAEYFNGFMVASGTVDKGMDDVAERLATDDDLGISHGFRFLTDEQDRSIITQYRSFELSGLPARVASNPYTALAVIQEEVKAMGDENGIPEEKRGFIAEKLGEERTSALESDTAKADAVLQAAGVDSKAADPPKDNETPTAITTESLAAAAVKAVTESKTMLDLAAAVLANTKATTDILARVTALEKTDDEKVAAQFASRVGDIADKRASEGTGNVIEKEEAEAAGAPKTDDIFAQVTEVVAESVGIPTS